MANVPAPPAVHILLHNPLVRDFAALVSSLNQTDASPARILYASPTENLAVQLFRYLIVGICSFSADFLMLYCLHSSGRHYIAGSAVSFLSGTMVNFFLTRYFVFKLPAEQEPCRGERIWETIGMVVITVIGMLLTMLLMFLFTEFLHLYFMDSKIISAAIVFFWNFSGRKALLRPHRRHSFS